MGYVDLILNLAGLLLWLNWRSVRFDPLTRRTPATLMGTLRPAAPSRLRRWHLLVFITGLLLLRALIYWWIGSATNWSGKLDFGVVVLWFSANSHWAGFCHMIAFSFFSFGLMLGIFYLCLLPLSLLAGPEPIHRLVKIPLGRVDDWPAWAKIILPFVATAVLWWLSSWLLAWLQIIPQPVAVAHRIEQSMIIGLDSYLAWRFPLGGILLLHLLGSYIYFGKHPFWKYVNATAQKLLEPLHSLPLRLGRMDFAPLLGLVIIFLLAHLLENGIQKFHIPGLIELYGKLPL